MSKFTTRCLAICAIAFSFLLITNCGGDDTAPANPQISIIGSIDPFGAVDVLSHSEAQTVQLNASELVADMSISASENFQISSDGTTFSSQLSMTSETVMSGNATLHIRFSPLADAIGLKTGTITCTSTQAENKTISVNGLGLSIAPVISVESGESNLDFEDTQMLQQSSPKIISIRGNYLESAIQIAVSEGFEVSLDNTTYATSATISAANANSLNPVYVRFVPQMVEQISGILSLENADAETVELNLTGLGMPVIHNYVTFNSERLAFGGSYNQSAAQSFNLHTNLSNIETVNMYVQLRCPTGGCDEWDVYANVQVKDVASGEWYELGRYITPYWNDNSQLERGFMFDVTDFKSMLTGSAELRIFTECWNDKGYEVTLDFDFIEGTPDYQYYAVSRVMQYNGNSLAGVPYGVAHSFDLDKAIAVPSNSENTHLRTVISGWGHATPNDTDGRPCAEWCYRTHDVLINGSQEFQHDLAPLGCSSNPVNNQEPGNWAPDRAGWCPGMEVPIRIDEFASAMAGASFDFEYNFEDWTSDGQGGNSFYAISTYVIVKSNTPIEKPVVTE